MKFTPDELRSLTLFNDLPEKLLEWLCTHGNRIELAIQDRMFTRGHSADYMFVVVEGTIHRYHEIGGQWLVVATTTRGQVTGMLPYSRMTHYPGHSVAAAPSVVLRIDKQKFNEMLAISHEFGQRLVTEMSNRVRADVRLEQQQEKMASLGRLSAGLAHELNNPAAAIRSTSASLAKKLVAHTAFIRGLARIDLKEEVIDAIENLLSVASERNSIELTSLQRSEREEELSNWLEERSIPEAWALVGIFAQAGLNAGDLEQTEKSIPGIFLGNALAWVAGDIEIDRMVDEIKMSAARVSELVSSIKSYSHMDQSIEHKPTDVHEGLDNTLKMFGHKLNQKNIQISRKYSPDLPAIPGNAGELNQVWTCIIDNAIDAMGDGGILSIETNSSDLGVDIKIIDDGTGIPEDIRHAIFDPFFTTKGVGQGTGLGLDIARRIVRTHQGQIEVRSRPGRTEMLVRLPTTPREI